MALRRISEPRLTVVLPLRGRHPFTLRFLWHANRARLPYHFLLADGQVHPQLAETLENCSATFPNISIEYVRYPDDLNLSRYYVKLADALSRVRTPYAMLADNDDFVCESGTERAISFLEENSNFVGSAGAIIGFAAYSGLGNPSGGLNGRTNRLYQYFDGSDMTSPLAAERLRQGGRNLWAYYAVYRSPALALICREVAEIGFSDLLFHEAYHVMRALTLGKVHLDRASVGYARQYGTSSSAAGNRQWIRQLVRGRFTDDVHGLVERIARAAAEADRVPIAEMENLALDLLEAKFAQFVGAVYGSMQEVKNLLRSRVPSLVSIFVNRPRLFIGRERDALFDRLASNGASGSYLMHFRKELALIEQTIGGEEFADFVRPYLHALRVTGKSGALARPHEHLA